MSTSGASSGGLGGFVGGVGQNIFANICAALIGGACVRIGVSATEKLEDWSNWPIWLALAGVLVLFTGAANALRLSFSRWRRRAAVRGASGGKIALLIAELEDDPGNRIRKTVRDSLKRELGQAIEIILWPAALALADGHDADAEATAEKTAQKWLRGKSCDILLWGRVKSNEVVSLRSMVAKGESRSAASHRLIDRGTEALDLPLSALTDLGAAIAARVAALAAPAITDSGHYLVPAMRAVANRLRPLAENTNAAFSADTRGMLLSSYALVCSTIGEQAGTEDDMTEAVAACRHALKERTRERVLLDWARTQNNLGNALQTLGEREAGTGQLDEAVTAYREALKECTRERVPLDWAMTQNNLGTALQTLGEREAGTAQLDGAVTAYREALKERTRERVPLDWAATQNNLGTALLELGTREAGTARLDKAVTAYREALKERTRERAPLHWAATQNNLGNALLELGRREAGTALLDKAVTAYREALKEYTPGRVPLDWAMTQNNLGNAHLELGRREAGTARLDKAVTAYDAALAVFVSASANYYVQLCRANRGNARTLLAQRRS